MQIDKQSTGTLKMVSKRRFSIADRLFVGRRAITAPRERIYCFPYAGAGGVVYSRWTKAFGDQVEVCPITPPGRLSRCREDPFFRMDDYIDEVVDTLGDLSAIPFAFFGYSMGGLVAFEVAKKLRSNGLPCPTQLNVAAARAPNQQRPQGDIPSVDEPAFLEMVTRIYGPLPEVILNDPEARSIALTTLKADFTMMATYEYTEETPLECAIHVFVGADDKSCTARDALPWRDMTAGKFKSTTVAGGHFFLNTMQSTLTQSFDLK